MYYERRYDKRHQTMMWVYHVELDGKNYRVERTHKMNYAVEGRRLRAEGHKVVRFTFVGTYIFEE